MELIIVLSIVSILLVLTLPSYQRQLINARRSLATAELQDIMIRQEEYFIAHKQYAETLLDLGFTASPYAIDSSGGDISVLAKNRVYIIDIATAEYTYTLYAKPQLHQIKDQLCATLSLNSMGVKSVTGDGLAKLCW